MDFLWPHLLWLLAVLPLLAALYIVILRRQKKAALRYTNLGLVREAAGRGPSVRRHVPAALVFLGIAGFLVSVARPTAVVTLPTHHDTVILAIDVSGSMRAEDVYPNRLVAAQSAAKAFVAAQPARTRVGIVEFSGSAALVQPPTAERADLVRVIDGLVAQNATAIGSAILVSLKALFPRDEFAVPEDGRAQRAALAPVPAPAPAEPGSYAAGAVILLTDGQNTMGPEPVAAARLAAERGVRIYTVGFGTHYGEIVRGEGWAMRVELDEATLRQVAELTRGEYFHASSGMELRAVYESLNAKLALERKATEITALFSGVAGLSVLLGAMLSLLWFNRIV
ncbi:MAG TPA: VWA domain-containing protein [Burkholderiales bacterium]|nr:VWA domain-containing protein [Burkholderiales bacterium]